MVSVVGDKSGYCAIMLLPGNFSSSSPIYYCPALLPSPKIVYRRKHCTCPPVNLEVIMVISALLQDNLFPPLLLFSQIFEMSGFVVVAAPLLSFLL